VAPDHPLVLRALQGPMSSTALRLLLRDPQAFVWTRALGWRPKEFSRNPLTLDPSAFGELVHELISMSVRRLDSMGGVQRTSNDEREFVVADVAADIQRSWPIERAVPPPTLWASTLEKARGLTLHALKVDEDLPHSLDSWTELSFGGGEHAEGAPWPAGPEVRLHGTDLSVAGRIDRLDLAKSRAAARITDYKTSRPPANHDDAVLEGCKELQRVLYATAVKQLLPDTERVVARLLYLGTDITARPLEGEKLDAAMTDLSRFVLAATAALRRGYAIPGPDAFDSFSSYRIARPADIQFYQSRAHAFATANAPLEEARSCP
jgi:RecB family exonuclease